MKVVPNPDGHQLLPTLLDPVMVSNNCRMLDLATGRVFVLLKSTCDVHWKSVEFTSWSHGVVL